MPSSPEIEPYIEPITPSLLRGSSAIKVIRNIFSMFTSAVLIRGASFILYILVGRFLGAHEFGQISLALSLFNTIAVIGVEWLAAYITREIAKKRSTTGYYLINGSVFAILTSSISLLLLYLFIRTMGYNSDTIQVIMWLGFGLFPYALSVINEAVFQAWERMHFIVTVQAVAGIIKLPVIYILLAAGYDIIAVVYVLIASHVITMILEWFIIAMRFETGPLNLSLSAIQQIFRDAHNFLGGRFVLAVRSSLSLVLITKFVGESGAGLFSAAAQFTVPAFLVIRSISEAIYPIMCRQFAKSTQALAKLSEKTFELKLIIAIPAAVGLTLLAEELLVFVYGSDEYILAANVLRIGAWALVVRAFTHVYGKVLFAANLEKLSFQIATIVTFVWLILELFFINNFGVVGAAIAVFLANFVNLLAHYLPVSRNLFKISIWKTSWQSISASMVMIPFILYLRSQNPLLTIAVSALVYAVSWILIAIANSGSISKFKESYIEIWASD